MKPWLVALAVSASLHAPGIAAAQQAPAAQLRIDAPAAAESSVSTPLVEVRGQAAAREIAAHDLVVVLDLSESSLLASGWDVDGDGPNGTTDRALVARLQARPDFPPNVAARLAESDFDDSVLAAELAAARALIERLDASTRNRVGIVVFSDRARAVAPLGAPRARLEAALAEILDTFHRELRGTNFGDAIGAAQLVLQPEVDGTSAGPPAGRNQSILLLSDGTPTLPPHGDRARQHALYAATAAAAAGIRVFPFELSRQSGGGRSVMDEIAQRSGGRFERLERPGDAIARLRRTDLVGLAELRVVNATTGAPARALRTFPDGSFDAFVELAPGGNRIAIEALTSDGRRAIAERVVVRSAETPSAPDAQRVLLEELRRRTRETELWVEIERERRAPKTELELSVEPPAPED